jgi:hypothetical protein
MASDLWPFEDQGKPTTNERATPPPGLLWMYIKGKGMRARACECM